MIDMIKRPFLIFISMVFISTRLLYAADTYTPNLRLTRPGRGSPPWVGKLDHNFSVIDAHVGNLNHAIDDLPEIEAHSSTFNSTTGVSISLSKTVDAIGEYSVDVTPTSRSSAIGDIWVVKSTSSFSVYCSESNTSDTFEAVIYYKGDVSSYGGSIYRRYYVSPSTSITDHSVTDASGSLAYVLNAMSGTSGIIEFPGNRTYTLTAHSVTIPAGIALFFQPDAKIEIGSGLTLTITDSSAIFAGTGQQIFEGDGDVRFTHGGAVWGNWFGMVGDDSTDSTDAWDMWLDSLFYSNSHGRLRKGIYLVASTKTLTGDSGNGYGKYFGIQGDVSGAIEDDGCVIKWAGTDDSANFILKLVGICRANFRDIVFNGDNKAGIDLWIEYFGSTDQYAPDRWRFDCVSFFDAKGGAHAHPQSGWTDVSGAAGLYIGGSHNCSMFVFTNCLFHRGTSALHISNPNAVSHSFIGCSFAYAMNGICVSGGGGFGLSSCAFGANYTADINLSIHADISIRDCWTEQSNMFLTTDNRGQTSSVTIEGCFVTSFPYDFYRRGYRTQPDANDLQNVAIKWNRPYATLALIGNRFYDPSFEDHIVRVWSSSSGGDNIINIGSIASYNEAAGGKNQTRRIVYTGTYADTPCSGGCQEQQVVRSATNH